MPGSASGNKHKPVIGMIATYHLHFVPSNIQTLLTIAKIIFATGSSGYTAILLNSRHKSSVASFIEKKADQNCQPPF